MRKSTSSTPMQDLSAELVSLVASTAPSLVSVSSSRSRSSGFVWRPGFIVTADEALSEEGDSSSRAGTAMSFRRSLLDVIPPPISHCCGSTDTDLQPISLTPLAVQAGALVVAVGAEDGEPTVALGVVSRVAGPWRSLRGGEIDARIELDLRLRQSAEGGVVLDAAGQSIGMAVFGPRRRVLVIPSSTIDRVAAKLESHGYIARGYLGLGLQPVAIDGDDGVGRDGYER